MESKKKQNYECYLWTELIGFDNTKPDLGVSEYIANCGFVPDGISLLVSHIDFVLLHQGMQAERVFPRDVCAREGHDRTRNRTRQEWTNYQLRALTAELHKHGIRVFPSFFTGYYHDKFHREWTSDHREILASHYRQKKKGAVNPLRRLKDGTYFEDILIARLVEVLDDYGFDGWHGADGYECLQGSLSEVDFSDDMISQFVEWGAKNLPDAARKECGDDYEKMERRACWIWEHRRMEWIEFFSDRWTRFWKKAAVALHNHGKKAFMNTSRCRDPFESKYRFGIDYRKLAEAGVDAFVVETVAAGLAIDPRCSDNYRHYDYITMFLFLKTYVPETKFVFLHNIHDVVEEWDSLHHCPTALEKEIYSHANVHVITEHGTLKRCADGFLGCLADGLAPHDWMWLEKRWELAFREIPRRTLGVTAVWSDTAFKNQFDDFIRNRAWFSHRIIAHLAEQGAPIDATVHTSLLEKASGAILITNPHLYSADEIARIKRYKGGPVILIGRDTKIMPGPDIYFEDVYPPHPLTCAVYGLPSGFKPVIEKDGDEVIPENLPAVMDPQYFIHYLYARHVSSSFLKACAEALISAAGSFAICENGDKVTVMISEMEDGRIRCAVKNKTHTYQKPQLDMKRNIKTAMIISEFPLTEIEPEGSRFSVKVPPLGIVVVDIRLTG